MRPSKSERQEKPRKSPINPPTCARKFVVSYINVSTCSSTVRCSFFKDKPIEGNPPF